MKQALIVGVGGFLGSVFRYFLSAFVQRWSPDTFPTGTLAVNVLGCFVVGMFWSLVEHRGWYGPEARLFFSVGVLGGFTTFSAFGYETFALTHDRHYVLAAANVAIQLLAGLVAVAIGWMVGRALPV